MPNDGKEPSALKLARVQAELLKEQARALAKIAQVFIDANGKELSDADRKHIADANDLVGRAVDVFKT